MGAVFASKLGREALRIGDTVRRPCGEWCGPVHALLRFLPSEGFGLVPQVLGIDEAGREILRWIERSSGGDSQSGLVRVSVRSDNVLVAVARLIRDLHDASSRFEWRPLAGSSC